MPGACLDSKTHVLLVRHAIAGVALSGRRREKGETILEALAREVNEETGVVLSGSAAAVRAPYANFDAFPGDHVALFVIRQWQQPRVPAPNMEIREQRFFPIEALPKTPRQCPQEVVGEILGNLARSEKW